MIDLIATIGRIDMIGTIDLLHWIATITPAIGAPGLLLIFWIASSLSMPKR